MVEFRSHGILEELKDWFVRLDISMQANKSIKHQDANIRLEDFFRDLLNVVYGLELVNANGFISTDQDSYDLQDNTKKIAVQVTVTTTAAKIKKTLISFVGNYANEFERLIFAYPVIQLPKSSAKYTKEKGEFDFETKRDRISLSEVLDKVSHLPLASQEKVLELVRDHLEPLGRGLHLGTDDVLDTLIDVIDYMSNSSPRHGLSASEMDPDYEKKSRRLREHVEYLEQQYSVNASLHAAIEQARDAIGYDQARAAKIQAWLKGESISLLRRCNGDAGQAFDELAETLLAKAHQRKGSAQMTAVRFLLADEFQRCNVFPNPGS